MYFSMLSTDSDTYPQTAQQFFDKALQKSFSTYFGPRRIMWSAIVDTHQEPIPVAHSDTSASDSDESDYISTDSDEVVPAPTDWGNPSEDLILPTPSVYFACQDFFNLEYTGPSDDWRSHVWIAVFDL